MQQEVLPSCQEIPSQPPARSRRGLIVAIGRFACGLLTISRFGVGLVSVSRSTIAVFALAQFAFAWSLIAQIGIYLHEGRGQVVRGLPD